MQRSSTSPDDFIASLPDGVRDDIAVLDAQLAHIFANHSPEAPLRPSYR